MAQARKAPSMFQIFNVFKTVPLAFGLLRDNRISLARRGIFGIIGLILAIIVIIPENPIGLAVSAVASPLLGIPVDLSIDWVIAAAILTQVMRIFPSEILSEHTQKTYPEK